MSFGEGPSNRWLRRRGGKDLVRRGKLLLVSQLRKRPRLRLGLQGVRINTMSPVSRSCRPKYCHPWISSGAPGLPNTVAGGCPLGLLGSQTLSLGVVLRGTGGLKGCHHDVARWCTTFMPEISEAAQWGNSVLQILSTGVFLRGTWSPSL